MFKVKSLLLLSIVGYLVLGNSIGLHASNVKKKYAKDGRLLWEFNVSDSEFKGYEYKVSGGQWELYSVRICKDLNGDMRIEKEKDVCFRIMKFKGTTFTTRGRKPKLLYIACNPSIIEVVKKDDLEIIQSQDANNKKERIIEHLKYSKNLHSFKKELEENLRKIDALQKSENHKFTDSDFKIMRKVLQTALLNVSGKIEVLKKEYSNIEFSIQPKDDFFLLGRKDKCLILKHSWNGLQHVDETRYDPWTRKQSSIKIYSKGAPETFFEIDEFGEKVAYANYIRNKLGEVISVEILERDGTANQRFLLNTINNPWNFMIKGASDKWINWPKQLAWPIMEERIKALLSHEFYNIRPFR